MKRNRVIHQHLPPDKRVASAQENFQLNEMIGGVHYSKINNFKLSRVIIPIHAVYSDRQHVPVRPADLHRGSYSLQCISA